MEEFFNGDDSENHPQQAYVPPQQEHYQNLYGEHQAPNQQNIAVPAYDFSSYPSTQPTGGEFPSDANDNDFNDFEEDEMTRRIREEEERIQTSLREKSQTEWEQKSKRQAEGRRQLEEFITRKEQEKRERAEENVRKEEELKQQLKKLNVEAGWRKVISNINVRAGEHKGPKDISRMREAILHRRQDDK